MAGEVGGGLSRGCCVLCNERFLVSFTNGELGKMEKR